MKLFGHIKRSNARFAKIYIEDMVPEKKEGKEKQNRGRDDHQLISSRL